MGFFSAPAFDAATITRSPSRRKYSGLTRGCPVLRPVVVSKATGMFWNVLPSPSPPPRRYMKVLMRDPHLKKKSVNGEFRNRGGDFEGMTAILNPPDERVKPNPDVPDRGLVGRDDEGLVDPGADLSSTERRLGQH